MTKLLAKHLARLYLPVFQYESDTLKIAYAGYSSIKRNYFVRVLLGKNTHHTFIGRQWFWKLPDLVKSGNLDMVISEVSRISLNHFQKCNGYILPEWIPMKIKIDRPLDEICRRSNSHFSDILKRIRKYSLTYEIITDRESFNIFINKFYLPFITRRHGDEALVEDLKLLFKSSPAPFLIVIKEDGIMVAGSLIRKSGANLYGLRMGVLDGSEEYIRHGVIGALYYFSILEGQKMGCRYLDIGGTRTFLSDTLTKYKMGLSAEFRLDHTPWKEYLWLGVNEHSAVVKEVMNRNPFMYLNNDNELVSSMV